MGSPGTRADQRSPAPRSSRRRPGPTPQVATASTPTKQPARTTTASRAHLTGRGALLLLVLAALVVTLAWPARALIDQRRAVASLRAENAATQERVDGLRTSLQRWQDPAYAEAQARTRLHFVRPRETAYVVVGPNTAPAAVEARVVREERVTWFDTLWQSVQGASADAG